MKWLSIALACAITGCSTLPPPPRIVEVPIAVSCVKDDVPLRPVMEPKPCAKLEGAECIKLVAAHIVSVESALDRSLKIIAACKQLSAQ